MTAPRVFVSYSHDTLDHKKWVLDLATRLRHAGIDAIIDQWELGAGDDLPHFMETQLAKADRVIMVCTDNYVSKANKGAGGVGYEKMIVTASLMTNIDDNKVIPIIRQRGTHDVPTFLKSKLFIDFSRDGDFEAVIDDLIRAIHGEPLYKKPEIGNNPFQSAEDKPAKKNNDAKMEVFKTLLTYYDAGHDHVSSSSISRYTGMSRILCEIYLNEFIGDALVKQNVINNYVITDKGRLFALQQGLLE
ncbi:toll/interleukin-1 receptor domain-containing protein [Vibrio parahaemolyticus]|nr:toll/interleukin-1 receptor domain-containing protein [Vibrio parahaemolyticus]